MSNIAIIGAGQQGASIARALAGTNHRVSIYDADPDVLHRFKALPQTDEVVMCAIPQTVVQDADIVVLATPIDHFQSVLESVRGDLMPGAIVTDIGSCKQSSIYNILKVLPSKNSYVPAHPINGKAKPGPEFSDPNMYRDQTIIVVPAEDRDAEHAVCQLWRDMGGKITFMDAETHDRLYGTISHFEHIVAFALTKAGEHPDHRGHASEDYKNAGKSALATTRIAASSADMWIPVFKDNQTAIINAIIGFSCQLRELELILELGSESELKSLIQEAHDYRTKFKDEKRETIEGEVADLAGLTDQFNRSKILATRIGVPTLIGAALTLNAMDTEKSLKSASLIELANPSFKDGSAPMLSDPDYIVRFLFENRHEVLEELKKFKHAFEKLSHCICNGEEENIRAYIEAANAIRADMPPKAAPATVRPQYETLACSLG